MSSSRVSVPRGNYVRRLVACYERLGDGRSAAEVLATYGNQHDKIDAARRFETLNEWNTAGEIYLAVGDATAAYRCFQQTNAPDGEVRALHAMGNTGQAGVVLLDMGTWHDALPLLQHAFATTTQPVERATYGLHLARALHMQRKQAQQTEPIDASEAYAHYTRARDILAHVPDDAPGVADCWGALGAWGATTQRHDAMQEGYAHALRLLLRAGDISRWHVVARRYRAAAAACANRRLVRQLDAHIAAIATP